MIDHLEVGRTLAGAVGVGGHTGVHSGIVRTAVVDVEGEHVGVALHAVLGRRLDGLVVEEPLDFRTRDADHTTHELGLVGRHLAREWGDHR